MALSTVFAGARGAARDGELLNHGVDMIRNVLLAAALAAALASPAAVSAAPATPMRLAPVAADTLRKAIERDRKDTEEWLRSKPNSYLATIARKDFGKATTLRVGRAPDNDVRLDDPAVEAHHLRVTVVGDSFQIRAVDPRASFTLGIAKDAKVVRVATLGPSQVGVGRFTLRFSHQHYPAIIVFDPKSPRFKLYHGIKYYPVDFAYRYELPMTPNPHPDTVMILSTRGNQRRALKVGWFDFMVGRTPCRLAATRLLEPGSGENDFSIFFRDATTGRETYPVGRYIEPEHLPGGRYILDFNVCYNPACAYSEHYNCPIPPKENLLKVAIRAGEMDGHYH